MTRLTVGFLAVLSALAFASTANALVCYDQSDLDAAGAGATVVWGDVAAEDEIVITETMFVRNGQTLQILPGTVIRGLPRLDLTQAASSAPGSLIVTQNAASRPSDRPPRRSCSPRPRSTRTATMRRTRTPATTASTIATTASTRRPPSTMPRR